MRGRVWGIKKSTILQASFFACSILCLSLILLSIFLLKNYFLWFFIFCTFAGVHNIIKSMLFRLDSACYIGFLLFFIGITGIATYLLSLENKFVYFFMASGVASITTTLFTGQKFQLALGILLSVTGLLSALFVLKVLNLAIFLSIYAIFLFIFSAVCVILFVKYIKRGG